MRTGLTDSAKEIREKLLAFWDDQARLDYDSVNRLKQTLTFVLTPRPRPFRSRPCSFSFEPMFSTLYSPDVASSWLHYATYLLLSQTTRSPDFERYVCGCDTVVASCGLALIMLCHQNTL